MLNLVQHKMSSSVLYLSLFFIVPTWSAGRDCESSDGYIRDHQDNVTDNCDYECGWAQCGDVCINAKAGEWCDCGKKGMYKYYVIRGGV